jgi:hypothetical protein
MVKIFGRDQVAWLAVVAAVFGVVTSYGFDISGHLQGIVSAVVLFVFAVANAVHVHDGPIALITGIATALFSLFAALNLDWTAGHQAYILGLLTVVGGFFVRTQVTSPVPASAFPAGKMVE